MFKMGSSWTIIEEDFKRVCVFGLAFLRKQNINLAKSQREWVPC